MNRPTFILADATGEPGLKTPLQDASTVLYLGYGPVPTAGESFAHEGLLWRARSVLEDGDLNPFSFPLIIAELA